eukprot:TRINITY_DN6117_c0_g1_i1.p1 TRINITY_DN6117_c0_g1~~TRINITY_DN6117_c0_g1_i1.p1  ORF type:complete len:262 (+),score=43.65 TRINITY_DN6117_c0_g1_i1:192-977(+)
MAALMDCRYASKMVYEADDCTDASTECGRLSSTGSSCLGSPSTRCTPLCETDASEVLEIGSTLFFLPSSIPAGVVMRNTFIDYVDDEQRGLAEMHAKRRTHSAPPAARAERVPHRESEADASVTSEPVSRSPSSSADSDFADSEEAAVQRMPRGALATLELINAANSKCSGVPVVAPPNGYTTPAEQPSIGSLAHYSGSCRPCGFFWKARGCVNGAECLFCHLCDGEEKKRRQKNRKNMLKAQTLSSLIPRCRLALEEDDD